MGFLKNSSLIFGVLLISSCSQLRDKNPRVSDKPDSVSQSVSFGSFQSTDGQNINLDDNSFDSIVVVFASDTCSTCAAEAKYWKQEFERSVPSNILFVHYIIGGHSGDAQDWKDSLEINWPVLTGESDSLYRQYCPAILTPCVVIKNNNTGEVSQSYKPLRKEELERYSGPWKN